MKILVTGAAGFIGAELCHTLNRKTTLLCGIDDFSGSDSDAVRWARLKRMGITPKKLSSDSGFEFHRISLNDYPAIEQLFIRHEFDIVIHLAAYAGIEHSSMLPYKYLHNNMSSFNAVIELCRIFMPKHFIFASSASVYGNLPSNEQSEGITPCYPLNIYAATKQSNEIIARCYAENYKLRTTGLRLFSVYGARMRCDLAPMKFSKALLSRLPITIRDGDMRRDFTHISDVVHVICSIIDHYDNKCLPPRLFDIFNVGAGVPRTVSELVSILESKLGVTAQIQKTQPLQIEASQTFAFQKSISALLGYFERKKLEDGLDDLVHWLKTDEAQPWLDSNEDSSLSA